MGTYAEAIAERARLMSGGLRCIARLDPVSSGAGDNRLVVRDLRTRRDNELFEHEVRHTNHGGFSQSVIGDWGPRGSMPGPRKFGFLSTLPSPIYQGNAIQGSWSRIRATDAGATYRSDVIFGDVNLGGVTNA